MRFAVSISAFGRKEYLQRCIESLEKQKFDLSKVTFYMFQDGAYNPISKIAYRTKEELLECKKLFLESSLPNKKFVQQKRNIGCALNVSDAITIPLKKYDVVLFMPEDVECSVHLLSKAYKQAVVYEHADNIGAVGFYPPIPPQVMLTWKKKWAKVHKKRKPFLDFIRHYDYNKRPTDLLAESFKVLTGDASRVRALAECGYKIIAYPKVLANHIGETGIHFTKEGYKERGYDKIKLDTIYSA